MASTPGMPTHVQFAMRSDTITQIQIDQALVGYACLFRHRLSFRVALRAEKIRIISPAPRPPAVRPRSSAPTRRRASALRHPQAAPRRPRALVLTPLELIDKIAGTPDDAPHRAAARYLWAMLLARIDEVFPLCCPFCPAEMRSSAFITEPRTVRQILDHLGEPTRPPRFAPARGPPLWEAVAAAAPPAGNAFALGAGRPTTTADRLRSAPGLVTSLRWRGLGAPAPSARRVAGFGCWGAPGWPWQPGARPKSGIFGQSTLPMCRGRSCCVRGYLRLCGCIAYP